MTLSSELRRHRRQVMRFLLVGALGFLVDAAVLLLFVDVIGLSRIWARLPSLLVAMTTTWWLHRHFTFSLAQETAPTTQEWARFVFGNAVGNGINLGVYWILVGLMGWGIVSALIVASILAAAINYTVSTRWVFQKA